MRESATRLVLPVLVAASLLAAPAAAAGDGLLGSMQCQCGCGKFLTTCDCGSADSGRAFVQSLSAQGKDDSEIAEAYGARFGEEYVNYVPKKGKGLSLWIMPLIGAVVGSAALYYKLKTSGDAATGAGINCKECGSTVESGQRFCSSCGSEVSAETCGGCGEVLSGDTKFCTGCGEPVGSSCPSCGEAVQSAAKFCSSCGGSL